MVIWRNKCAIRYIYIVRRTGDPNFEKSRFDFQEQCDEYSPTKSLEVAVNQCLDATKELRVQLIATCKEQSHDLPLIIRTGYDLVTFIQTTSSDGDVDSLNKYGDQFVEVVEQIGEVRAPNILPVG